MDNFENTADTNQPAARGASVWPLFALLIIAAAALVVIQWRRPREANPFAGRLLPPLEVAGWLNTDRPLLSDDLRGKLVLVDFWSTDCGYCIEEMPKLVELRNRYRDKGLVVIGLTPESNDPLGRVNRYVEGTPGMDWPIGLDAGLTFEMLGVSALPTYILFDHSGRAVWGTTGARQLGEVEDAIVAELARK